MARSKKRLLVFDPTEAIEEALAILKEADASFALAGCLAAWVYVPADGKRLTQDVDFAVKGEHMEAVVKVAKKRGYRVEKLGAGGYRIKVGDVPVDFIDGRPYLRELFDFAVEHASEMDIGGGLEFPVVRKEYLVAMKAAAGGKQDEWDLEWLLRTVDGKKNYRELRSFVISRVGYVGAVVLDKIARGIGHPGPGPLQRN